MSSYHVDDDGDRDKMQGVIAAIRARGAHLRPSSMMDARRDFLRLVRELRETELVLMKRGRLKGALLSREGWLNLHRTIEDLTDEILVLEWPHSDLPPIPLERAMPLLQYLALEERRPLHAPDHVYDLKKETFHVQLTPMAAWQLDAGDAIRRRFLISYVRDLRSWPYGGEPLGASINKYARRRKLPRARIVWRIDDEVVTVVRIGGW